MKSVCHILSGDLWGGAEAVTCQLLKELKSFHDVNLRAVVMNPGRVADRLRDYGIDCLVMDESQYPFRRLFRKVYKSIQWNDIDIIHSHRYKENIIAGLLQLFFNKIQLVATQHGLPEVYAEPISLQKRMIHRLNFFLLSKRFHSVVAVSADLKKSLLSRYGVSNCPVRVIRNGIQMPCVDLEPENKPQEFMVGSAGRLVNVKDFHLLVEIAATVNSQNQSIHFVLAGDGPNRQSIQQKICHHQLQDFFSMPGHVGNMSAFYSGLQVYVNTSIHEGLPISILEAMAFGLPVIAPDVGGLSEIIEDGKEGFLVATRNPVDFAYKCLDLYNNIDLRRRMSTAARRKIEGMFSSAVMARQYHRLYEQLLTNIPIAGS